MNLAENSSRDTLLIWDYEEHISSQTDVVVLWRQFSDSKCSNTISIPELVESNSDILREKILSLIYKLGKSNVQGKTLIEHLQIAPNFSYWWMTLLSEKCNFSKSQEFNEAIRLLAFELFVINSSVKKIVLKSTNKKLIKCLELFCARRDIVFESSKIIKISNIALPLLNVIKLCTYFMRVMGFLIKYYVTRWPLRGIGVDEWVATKGQLTFFTYTDNSPIKKINEKEGCYKSNYWSCLPDVLNEKNINSNWLHLYIKDSAYPDSAKAALAFKAFNERSVGKQVHVFLDSFLAFDILYKTLFGWISLLRIGMTLSKNICIEIDESINFWPIFQDAWFKSLCDIPCVDNLLNLFLFRKALGCLPKQRRGVYLQENQAWELALIEAWRINGHQEIIGFPHSTIRFWDLRYYHDSRTYDEKNTYSLPRPDKVAINGDISFDAYKKGGYPLGELVSVESLRYLRHSELEQNNKLRIGFPNQNLCVVFLGDYVQDNNCALVSLLKSALMDLPFEVDIIIKEHPNCRINIDLFKPMNVRVVNVPLEELFRECDIAYASAVTSAAVDAYILGVKVITILDPKILNFSPLRGNPNVTFVKSANELAFELTKFKVELPKKLVKNNYFYLNKKIPFWKSLLEL